MRCYQARQELNRLGWSDTKIAQEMQLVQHLQNCPACAGLLKAEQSLKSDLRAASLNDNEEVIPMSVLKARVEYQAAKVPQVTFMEKLLMAPLNNLFTKRPKLGIGLAVTIVALLISALVPFTYDNTIGYEVAFAGVDRTLAMDQDKIQDILLKLGVEDAAIDVSDCEATCKLFISDLKSSSDAQMIKAAFINIDQVELLHDIKEMVSKESGTLIHKVKIDLLSSSDNVFFSEDDAHKKVIEIFGDSMTAELIFISEDCSELDSLHFKMGDAKEGDFAWFGAEINVDSDDVTENVNVIAKYIKIGDSNCNITGLEGIDFENLTDEDIQKLKDLGYVVEIIESADGTTMVKLMMTDVTFSGDPTEDDDEAAKENPDLPEGYTLSQNYPNPFNPTTTISYSLPKSEHVTIDIYNINGQVVRSLVDQVMSAGTHTIEWDATSDGGTKVATGMYLYRFNAGDISETKKMTLMK